MYQRLLDKWLAGKLTVEQIDLLVKCEWITYEQGEEIKSSPR